MGFTCPLTARCSPPTPRESRGGLGSTRPHINVPRSQQQGQVCRHSLAEADGGDPKVNPAQPHTHAGGAGCPLRCGPTPGLSTPSLHSTVYRYNTPNASQTLSLCCRSTHTRTL